MLLTSTLISIAVLSSPGLKPTFNTAQQEPTQLVKRQMLILPVANTTGEKNLLHRERMTIETDKTLAEELASKGYGIVSVAETKKIINDSKIDLADEENWKRDIFFDLGSRSNSEFVCFATIVTATQRIRVNLFSSVPEGEVTVKCWFLNVAERKPVISAKIFAGKARSKTNLFGEAKGTDSQVEASRRAVKEAVKEFMTGGRG